MMRFFKVGDVIQSIDDSQVDAFLKNNPDAIEISAPTSIARDKTGTNPTLSPKQKAQIVTDIPVPKPLTTEEYANLLLKPNKTKQEEASINEYINRTGGLTKTVKDIETGKEYIIPKDEYNPEKHVEIGKINIGEETSKILKQRDLERQKYIEELNTQVDILKDYINQRANDISKKLVEEYDKLSQSKYVGQSAFSYGGAKGLVGIYDPINVQKYNKALIEFTKTLDILDEVKEKLTEDKGFFTPLANKKPYLDLITGGFYGLLSSAPIMNIATKLKKGVKPEELSDSEKALIQSLLLKQQTAGLIDPSTGYKLGEILAGTIPFISAFGATLPLRKLVSRGIKKAAGIAEKEAAKIAEKEAVKIAEKEATNVAEKGIGDVIEKGIKDIAEKEATKLPVETLGQKAKRIAVSTLAEVPATAVQTVVQPTTYKDIAENAITFEEKENGEIVPVSNIGEAAKQSFINNFGNNLFELAGEPVTGFFSKAFSKMPFKIGETYSKVLSKIPKLPKAGKEFNRAIGLSTTPGQVIEEELGKAYDATVNSDDPIKAFFDNQKELILGTSLSTILLGAPANIVYQTGNTISYLTYRKAKNSLLNSGIDEATKTKIIDIVDNANNVDDIFKIADVVPENLSKEDKKKIVDYAIATVKRKINYGNFQENIERQVVNDSGNVEVAKTKDGSAIFVKEKDGGKVIGIDAAGNEVEVKDEDISDSFFLPVEEFRSVLNNTIDEHEERLAEEKEKQANENIAQQQEQDKVQGTQEQTQELPNELSQATNQLQSQPENILKTNAETNTENVVTEQVQQNLQPQQEQPQQEKQEGKSFIESKEVADTESRVESKNTTIPTVDEIKNASLVNTPIGKIFVISNEDGKIEYIDVKTGKIKYDTYDNFINKYFGGQVESSKGTENIEASQQQEGVTQRPVQEGQVQEQVNPVSDTNVEVTETVPTQEGNIAETISPVEQTQDNTQEKPKEQINEEQPVINEQVAAETIPQPEVNERQPIIQQQEAGQQTTEQPTENIQTTEQAGENLQTTEQPEEKTFEAQQKESFNLPNETESNWQQVEAINEGIYKPTKVVFFTHKDNTYEYLGEDKDNYFIRNSDNITYSIPKKEKALSKDIEKVKKEKGISVPKNFFENTNKNVEVKEEQKESKVNTGISDETEITDVNVLKRKLRYLFADAASKILYFHDKNIYYVKYKYKNNTIDVFIKSPIPPEQLDLHNIVDYANVEYEGIDLDKVNDATNVKGQNLIDAINKALVFINKNEYREGLLYVMYDGNNKKLASSNSTSTIIHDINLGDKNFLIHYRDLETLIKTSRNLIISDDVKRVFTIGNEEKGNVVFVDGGVYISLKYDNSYEFQHTDLPSLLNAYSGKATFVDKSYKIILDRNTLSKIQNVIWGLKKKYRVKEEGDINKGINIKVLFYKDRIKISAYKSKYIDDDNLLKSYEIKLDNSIINYDLTNHKFTGTYGFITGRRIIKGEDISDLPLYVLYDFDLSRLYRISDESNDISAYFIIKKGEEYMDNSYTMAFEMKKNESKNENKEIKDEQNIVDTDTNLDKTKDIVHSARILGNAPAELKDNEFTSKEDFYNFLESFVMNKVGIRKFHVVEDPNDPNALDELIGLVDSQTAKKILEDFSNPEKVVNSAYIKNYDIIIFNGIPETKEDAFSLFVHEALVHRGMRVFFENEYEKNEFLGKIYDEIGIDGIKAAMDEYDERHGYEVGSSFEAYKDLSKEALAEEYIAILSDKVKNKLVLSPVEQKWWDKVLEYIRKFIDKIRQSLGGVQLTQEDVEIFTEYLINFGLHSLRGNIVNPKQKQDIIDRINEVAASLTSIKASRTGSGKIPCLMNANDFFYKKVNYNGAGFLTPDGKVIVKPLIPRGAHNDLAAKLLEGVAEKFPEIKEAIYTEGKIDKNKAFEYLTEKLGYIRIAEGVNEEADGRTEFIIDVYSFATREQVNILKDMLKKYMNDNQFYVTISNNRPSSIVSDKIKNEVDIPDKIENINKTINYNSPLRDFLYSQRKRLKTVDEIFPENKKVGTKVLRKFADYLLPLRTYLRSSGMSFQDANTVVNLLYKAGSAAYGRMKIFKETTYKNVTNSVIDLIKKYDKGLYDIDRNNWKRDYEETLVKANRQLRDGTITQTKYDEIITKAKEELNRKIQEIRYKDIDLYMIAKHAIERNETMYKKELIDTINGLKGISEERKKAMISSIMNMPIDENKKKKINFSGMTTTEAEDIVAGFEKNVDEEFIDKLWKSINSFNSETEQLAKEYGYFTDENKNIYGWKYYVPLQYFADTQDVNQSLTKSLFEKMEGRQSLPKSPLTSMLKKYSDLVYFGEINLAKKKLSEYIEGYGFKDVLIGTIGKYNNEDVIVANGKVYRLVVNENGKLVINDNTYIGEYENIGANIEKGLSADTQEELLDKNVNFFNGEAKLGYVKNYTQFFKDGKLHFMVFENPDINRAINASNVVFVDNKITKAFAALTRTLATLYTTFSLPFQGRNYLRDFQTSGAYKLINGKTIIKNKRFKDLSKEEKSALFELFLKSGGQTGRANLQSLEDVQEDLVNDIYDIVELQTSSGIKHFDKLLKKYGKNFIDKIISISEKVERFQRFKVFAVLYSNGATLDEAISAAKEITVNFDRRGELSTVISSYIAFFNPAVQAMYQQYQWITSGDKKILGKYFTVAFGYSVVGVLNGLLEDYLRDIFSDGDDDEDRIFQRPSSYLRYNNFIFTINGYSVIFPVSQAYAFFYGLGKIAYERMNGYLTQDESISEAAMHLVTAYSPVTFDYGTTNENDLVDRLLIYSIGSITAAKPIVIASVNKQLITKQKNDIYFAKSALGKDRTSDVIKDFAVFMHNATGGDLPKSSLDKNLTPVIDIDPNLLEYFIVNYGGGVAQAGLALADGIYELTKKNDNLNTFDPTDLYIVRSFVKNTKESYDYSNFLQAVDYINRMRNRLKAANDTYNEKIIKDEYGLASTELPEYNDEIGEKLNITKKKYEYFAFINKIYQVYLNMNEKRNNLLDILQANNEGFLDDSVANKDLLIDAINQIDEIKKEIAKMINYNFYLYERVDNVSPEFIQESINDLEKRLNKVISKK